MRVAAKVFPTLVPVPRTQRGLGSSSRFSMAGPVDIHAGYFLSWLSICRAWAA